MTTPVVLAGGPCIERSDIRDEGSVPCPLPKRDDGLQADDQEECECDAVVGYTELSDVRADLEEDFLDAAPNEEEADDHLADKEPPHRKKNNNLESNEVQPKSSDSDVSDSDVSDSDVSNSGTSNSEVCDSNTSDSNASDSNTSDCDHSDSVGFDSDVSDDVSINKVKKKNEKKKDPSYFTNGFGLDSSDCGDNTKLLKSIIETASSKKSFQESSLWTPSLRTTILLIRWSRCSKRHFMKDADDAISIISSEFGVSPEVYLSFRVWHVTVRKDVSGNNLKHWITYKRAKLVPHTNQTNTPLLADTVAGDTDAPTPPTLESEHFKCAIAKLYAGLEKHGVIDCQPKNTLLRKKGNVRKPVSDGELIEVLDENSFTQRIVGHTHLLHLGLIIVNAVFWSVCESTDMGSMYKMLNLMASSCSSRKRYIAFLMRLCIYFPSDEPDVDKASELIKKGPSSIPNAMKELVNEEMGRCYRTRLDIQLKDTFKFTVGNLGHNTDFSKYGNTRTLLVVRSKIKRLWEQGSYSIMKNMSPGRQVRKRKSPHSTSPSQTLISKDTSGLPPKPTPSFFRDENSAIPGAIALFSLTFRRRPPTLVTQQESQESLHMTSTASEQELDFSNGGRATQEAPEVLPYSPRTPSSYITDLDQRMSPSKVVVATENQVRQFGAHVYIETPFHRKTFYLARIEFYSARCLRDLEHGMAYTPPGDTVHSLTVPTFVVPDTSHYLSHDLSVLRGGHPLLNSHMEGLDVNLSLILRWVIEHGSSNAVRDGSRNDQSSTMGGNRIDFGCGGQNWIPTDENTTCWKPCQLCCLDVFDSLDTKEDQEIVRITLGRIFDGIQNIEDGIHHQLGIDVTYQNQDRFEAYGRHLQEFLFARNMKNEWITIQAKCLSRKDQTHRHKDIFNCNMRGYDKTACLCFVVEDGFGDVWSLKFIANSRAVVGSYFMKKVGCKSLLENIQKYLNKIDCAYANYISNHENGGCYSDNLTWASLQNLWLDNASPYEKLYLGNQQEVAAVMLPTAIVRDYWLSPAVHWITRVTQTCRVVPRTSPQDWRLDLPLIACYLPTMARFFHIGNLLWKDNNDIDPTSGGCDFCKKMISTFGTMVGGPFPRFSPPGLNIFDIFYKEGKEPYGTAALQELRMHLNNLCNSINQCAHPMPKGEIEEIVKSAALNIAKSGKEQNVKYELGEFRLMIFLNVCALSNIKLVPHARLRDLAYPIEGFGSKGHLLNSGVSEDMIEFAMDLVDNEYGFREKFGENAMEGTLCESAQHRNVVDIFMKGQDIFLVFKDGTVMKKAYGTNQWVPALIIQDYTN